MIGIFKLVFVMNIVLKGIHVYVGAEDIKMTIYLSDGSEAPSTVRIIKGDVLHLTCQYDFPSALIAWSSSFEPQLSRESTLQIYDLRIDQGGEYIFTVYNNTLTQIVGTTSITVDVLFSPTQVMVYGPYYSLDYENLTLQCHSQGNPTPSFFWSDSYDGSIVLHRGPVFNTIFEGSMFIFYCHASNTLFPTLGATVSQSSLKKFEIEYQIKINMYIENEEYYVEEGSRLVIDCEPYGHPPPTIWWTRGFNQTQIASGPRLTLKNAQFDFEDVYTCYGVNTVTTSEGDKIITTSTDNTYVIITPATSTTSSSTTSNTASTTPGNMTFTDVTDYATPTTTNKACQDQQISPDCSNTVMIALVAGWVVAAILILVGTICIIRVGGQHKKKNDWHKHHESFDQISSGPSVQFTNDQRDSITTTSSTTDYSGYRPHLPRRPGVDGRDHTYSTLDGLQSGGSLQKRGSPDGSNPSRKTQDDDDGYLSPKSFISEDGDYVVPYITVIDKPGTCGPTETTPARNQGYDNSTGETNE